MYNQSQFLKLKEQTLLRLFEMAYERCPYWLQWSRASVNFKGQ